MTIRFNISNLEAAKSIHPEWVFFLADKEKNPQTIVGKWKEIKTQSLQELELLIANAKKRKDVEAWCWGIRTGVNNVIALDFDWEFLGYRWIRRFGDSAKTAAFRTANLGFRFIFYTTESDTDNPYKNNLHTEFENGTFAVLGGYALNAEGEESHYEPLQSLTLYPDVTYTFPDTLATDNTIIADTKKWLREELALYDFLEYKCIKAYTNKKHIRLTHDQRLAILNFMLAKDFSDEEIHDFFIACYDSKGRDYARDKTDAQITSGRAYKEKGGKPYPCTVKTQDNGKVSIPLYQIFCCDPDECKKGCSRKKKPTKTPRQEAKERDVAALLEELRGKYHFKTPEDIRELYVYSDGVYVEAQCKLEAELEEKLGAKGYTAYINEIIEHLKRSSYVPRATFNQFHGDIPVLNGLLNLANLQLINYDPDKIFTFKINAFYNPEAKCPKFQKFLDDTLETKEDQQTLQEYTGYCLMPTFPFHKTMWFIGGGRNGKGTFIRTLEAILGPDNCAHINISQLNGDRNFSEYGLYGKLINVSSEPTTNIELETPLIKKLTCGDVIDAEVKNKQHRVKFTNSAKFFILGNKYPKVNDDTTAFWERVLLLRFNGVFLEGQGQIQDIEKTWLSDKDEVSGILNWMIEGLQRLLINCKFTVSKSQQETKLDFKRSSDPFNAWLEENCVFGKDYYIPRSVGYPDYKEYCFNLQTEPKGEKAFNTQLRGTPRVQDLETTRKEWTNPKEKRFWIGLCLKSAQETQDKAIANKNKAPKQNPLFSSTTPETPKTPSENNCQKNTTNGINQKNKELLEAGVSGVLGVAQENKETVLEGSYHTSKSCGRWKTGECQYPGDPNSVTEDSSWCYECKGWTTEKPKLRKPVEANPEDFSASDERGFDP